jgi:hypothetical protein
MSCRQLQRLVAVLFLLREALLSQADRVPTEYSAFLVLLNALRSVSSRYNCSIIVSAYLVFAAVLEILDCIVDSGTFKFLAGNQTFLCAMNRIVDTFYDFLRLIVTF